MTWPLVAIKDVSIVVTGKTPPKKDADNFGGDIPFVTPRELGRDKYVSSSPQTLTAKGATFVNLVPEHSIMVCCIGSLGKLAIAGADVATNQQINSVIFDQEKVDSKYGYYALRCLKQQMESIASSTTIAIINKSSFQALQIPLPPLPEQRRIAAILDKADELRQKRRQAIEKLDQLLQSVFLDMFGDPVTNPKVAVASLGDHLTFVTSGGRGWAKYYSETGERFIRSLDVQMNAISGEDIVFVSPPDNAEAKRTKIRSGDVLLTITGSRIGRVSAVPDYLSGAYVSQHVAILRPNKTVMPEFLSQFLSMGSGGQRQIAKLQYGQTKPGLNFRQIQSFEVPLPEIDEQQKFVNVVKKVAAQRKEMNEQLNSAQHFFQAIQQRAFNGTL